MQCQNTEQTETNMKSPARQVYSRASDASEWVSDVEGTVVCHGKCTPIQNELDLEQNH